MRNLDPDGLPFISHIPTGQEEFDRLRSLSYAETHVVMVCFSVDNPVSLENVESKVHNLAPHHPSFFSLLMPFFFYSG